MRPHGVENTVKKTLVVMALALAAGGVRANEFSDGCEKAGNEILCPGRDQCAIGALLSSSAKGNNTERGGYEECSKLAKAIKARKPSADAKKALKRLNAKLAKLNKELKKEFPYLKVTADFDRLALEDAIINGVNADARRSLLVGLAPDDKSDRFETTYLNDIKTTLYNVAKDDEGKAFLKERVTEVRLGFFTHGRTGGTNLKIRRLGKVVVVPGIYSVDQTGYARGLQEWMERQM